VALQKMKSRQIIGMDTQIRSLTMGKIIKVKGWNTIIKKMYSPEELAEDQLTLMPNGQGFINVSGVSTRQSKLYAHITPVEWTNMMDNNGKEMYDNDICKVVGQTRDHGEISLVGVCCWSEVQKCFTVWFRSRVEFIGANRIEVIGSIERD